MMQVDASQKLQLAQVAIDNGDIDLARDLLRPLMASNVVEAFYLASRVAYTQEQALGFLRHALQLAPNDIRLKRQIAELERLYQAPQILASTTTFGDEAASDKIRKAIALFESKGWTILDKTAETAHVAKRQVMSAASAFLVGLMLNIIGVGLIIVLSLASRREHVFIEADTHDLLLSTKRGERLMSQPSEVIFVIDEMNSTSRWAALLWVLLGAAVGGVLWLLLLNHYNIALQDLTAALDNWANWTATPRFRS